MTNAEKFKEIFTRKIKRAGADKLLEWLESTDFFKAPASRKHHGAYSGGLVDHSLNVYYALIGNFKTRNVCTEESHAIVALLHDVCKINYYYPEIKRRKNDEGKWENVPGWGINDRLPMGHGEKSVYLIQKYMQLTDDEALAIRWHMGAYDEAFRGGNYALNAAMQKTPLVLALHYADMTATQDEREKS